MICDYCKFYERGIRKHENKKDTHGSYDRSVGLHNRSANVGLGNRASRIAHG